MKIRIAWICHLSNQEIRNELPLRQKKIKKTIGKLIGKKLSGYGDFALWNCNDIKQFEKFDDIELHIVSPHQGLKKTLFEYKRNNVYYHFFRADYYWLVAGIINLVDPEGKCVARRNSRIINNLIEKIKPTLINLIGSENPYYSKSILRIDNIPILLTCQTIYCNPDREKYSKGISGFRWTTEQDIFKKVHYYNCTSPNYYRLIKMYSPDSCIFPVSFAYLNYPILNEVPKQYDFAFFAQSVSKKKGIDSALFSLEIVKRKYPNVTLLVVGHRDDSIKKEIQEMINKLELKKNVFFHDFFPNHDDMLQYVKRAKYALLPVKLDFISGTIIDAFYLQMPVITHKTKGTPLLNKNGETVLISEVGDVEKMASDMIRLIEDNSLSEIMINNGLKYLEENYDSFKNSRKRVEQYKVISSNYLNGTPIPVELLFNEKDYL